MDGGQIHRGVQAVVGDLVSVGVRDAGDEGEAGLSALGRDDPDYRFDPSEAQPEATRITAMFREVDWFSLGW